MTVDQNIPIKMNDGVTLIANVGYPTDLSTGQRASGRFPVVLTQDPYASETQSNSYYVTRGYINAVVEVRGTGDTHGPGGAEVKSPFFGPRQTKDAVALVKWAAHTLAGSNGVIGLDGCSFLGIDQIFTAAAVGPNSPVKEILPACASNDYNNCFAGTIASPGVSRARSLGFSTAPSPVARRDQERVRQYRTERRSRASVRNRWPGRLQREVLATANHLQRGSQHRKEQDSGSSLDWLVPDGWSRITD